LSSGCRTMQIFSRLLLFLLCISIPSSRTLAATCWGNFNTFPVPSTGKATEAKPWFWQEDKTWWSLRCRIWEGVKGRKNTCWGLYTQTTFLTSLYGDDNAYLGCRDPMHISIPFVFILKEPWKATFMWRVAAAMLHLVCPFLYTTTSMNNKLNFKERLENLLNCVRSLHSHLCRNGKLD